MGVCVSKDYVNPVDEELLIAELRGSMHKSKAFRESFVRHRDSFSLEDAYEVIGKAGEGSIGTVSIVRKKHCSKLYDLNTSIEQHVTASSNKLVPSSNGSLASNFPSRRRYACKTITSLNMNYTVMTEFINEVEILRYDD